MTSLLLALLAPVALAADPPSSDPAPAPPPAPAPDSPAAGTTPASGADQPADPDAITEMPSIAQYVEAPYPPDAEAQGLEGTVRLLVTLDEQGNVTDVQVEQPIGNGFDEAAIAAVQQMKFNPAKTASGPIAVQFEFDYGFQLKKAEPPPEAPKPVNLEGDVHEMGTRKALAGVRVIVEDTDLVAQTDDAGHFEIRGVPEGAHVLKVLDPGHVVLEQPVDVAEGKVTSANLWIRAEEYRENEAVGVYKQEKQEVTQRTLSIDEVKSIPGTFGDPVKVVQTLPGAARSPFGTGLLVIRGSNPEDSGVYVDGVRIPIIYHLTGTTSVLSPDIIEAVDYLPGGYGVQYGRGMGGVVDVKTKSKFDADKIVWGTDILDSQLYFEGNVGKEKKSGLAVGARRSYIDAFLPLFLSGGYTIKPRYWDYQTKYIPYLGDDQHSMSVFVYGFNDLLAVSTPKDVAQGSDQDTQGDLKTQYSSHRVLLHYHQDLGEGLALDVSPSVGLDYELFGLGDDFTLNSWNWIVEGRAELPYTPNDHVQLVPGLDFIGGWWKFVFASPFKITELDDPLSERESVKLTGHGSGWGPDFYVKANLRPTKDPDRLLITPGVRTNYVTVISKGDLINGGQTSVLGIFSADPRVAGRWAVVKDRFWIKGGTGIYHQPPQPYQTIGVGTDSKVTYEHALSSDFGFEHNVTPAVSWDLDLFYKDMRGLIEYNEGWSGYGDVDFVNLGRGRAYGAELILRAAHTGRFFGWISYTLSKAERQDAPGEKWYPFEFDQPHILSAQGGYDLPLDIQVSAQVQYVSGDPDTPYNAGVYDVDGGFYNGFRVGAYDGERLPPYFQTSVRFDRLWTFKSWQLDTYLDLMNVVRGVNPEFTTYNYDYTEHTYIRGIPFIPNLGIEARFWP